MLWGDNKKTKHSDSKDIGNPEKRELGLKNESLHWLHTQFYGKLLNLCQKFGKVSQVVNFRQKKHSHYKDIGIPEKRELRLKSKSLHWHFTKFCGGNAQFVPKIRKFIFEMGEQHALGSQQHYSLWGSLLRNMMTRQFFYF